MNDTELLELLKSSPQEGIAAAVKKYSAYVYKIVFTRLRGVCTNEDIEEAVSDIFMKFYLASQKNDTEIYSVCAYLAVTAQRHSINVFKKTVGRKTELSLDDLGYDLPDENISAETADDLTDAIHALGSPDSDIFVRRYYFGQSVADIANGGYGKAVERRRLYMVWGNAAAADQSVVHGAFSPA